MSKDVTLLEEIAEQDLAQISAGMNLFGAEVDDKKIASLMLPVTCVVLPQGFQLEYTVIVISQERVIWNYKKPK